MVSGIIVSGGNNSRMQGKDKAFLEINGQTIISKTLNIFKDIFKDIWIITNSPKNYSSLKDESVSISRDLIKGKGPLGGIYTGLKNMKNETGFFVGCDMPNLHIGLIKRQILLFQKGRYECMIPIHNNYIEPLHAIYTKPLAKKICSFIKENSSNANKSRLGIRRFIEKCRCGFMEVRGKEIVCFSNVNTLEAYKKWDGKIIWR